MGKAGNSTNNGVQSPQRRLRVGRREPATAAQQRQRWSAPTSRRTANGRAPRPALPAMRIEVLDARSSRDARNARMAGDKGETCVTVCAWDGTAQASSARWRLQHSHANPPSTSRAMHTQLWDRAERVRLRSDQERSPERCSRPVAEPGDGLVQTARELPVCLCGPRFEPSASKLCSGATEPASKFLGACLRERATHGHRCRAQAQGPTGYSVRGFKAGGGPGPALAAEHSERNLRAAASTGWNGRIPGAHDSLHRSHRGPASGGIVRGRAEWRDCERASDDGRRHWGTACSLQRGLSRTAWRRAACAQVRVPCTGC